MLMVKLQQTLSSMKNLKHYINLVESEQTVSEEIVNEVIKDTEATECKQRAEAAKAKGDMLEYWKWMWYYYNRQKSLHSYEKRRHYGMMSPQGRKHQEQANKYLDKQSQAFARLRKLGGTINRAEYDNTYDKEGASAHAQGLAKWPGST